MKRGPYACLPGGGRRRAPGFTIVELMVVIAIATIATAVALPDMSAWLVNSRIQDAAGDFQQNIQWARAYALRTDQEVDVVVTAQGAGGCTWSMTLPTMNNRSIHGAPSMSAVAFAARYHGISCSAGAAATLPLMLMPNGTILAPPQGGGVPTITNGYLAFGATSDSAQYATWLVKYYGAGDLRSCIMAPLGAQNPVATCANS